MKRMEFIGTDQEVLDFLGIEKFDYETDYGNASVNIRLFGSHGNTNVPLGYVFYKDTDDSSQISIVSDSLDEIIKSAMTLKHNYNKANEWHYVKDGDLPDNLGYVWTNVGAGYHDDDGWWDDYGRLQGVIAWCEPKFEGVEK